MKRSIVFALAIALLAACSTREMDIQTPFKDDVVFFASFEKPEAETTKVYATEELLLRWTADDRVSIFNKNTYNQQYAFTGETGDNAGGFRKVESDEFMTGNAISNVVSVYPYQTTTRISESEAITVTLPAEQSYAQNTFGLGANTMVSVTSDNFLQYKNVGGYLMLKLYGEGVSVSSVTLKGNNGEKLAGKATVSMPLDGVPSVVMATDATSEITLICDTPIQLGASAEESTAFWFVVPPVTFSKGFTITVNSMTGVFEKATDKSLSIERNILSKMSSIEVVLTQPNNVIYYISRDWQVVTPHSTSYFGANVVSNKCVDGYGAITFDGPVTSIGFTAFAGCSTLASISIPSSVTTIGTEAFVDCSGLQSIDIPEGVVSIGPHAFGGCTKLNSVFIPRNVSIVGQTAFANCTWLMSISVASDNPYYDSRDNCNAIIKTETNMLVSGCSNTTIPKSVTSIGYGAFEGCTRLISIHIPDNVTSIGDNAFYYCLGLTDVSLPATITSIGEMAFYYCHHLVSFTVNAMSPPKGGPNMLNNTNDCPIYVPFESVEAYKTAQYWSEYADRIQAIVPLLEAVDLGLSVKWASFNLGASRPEEYGDYYAWGETEPYYFSQDPLTWENGKESGYCWASYKWCMGDDNTLTKYCDRSDCGYDGFTDTKLILDPEDDAAQVNLGGNWRMPTAEEWTELMNNCTWTWTSQYGVNGRLVTASNGNSIFLPAAGYRNHTYLGDVGTFGNYWSSSLETGDPSDAWFVDFNPNYVKGCGDYRYDGFSVRPVCAE